MEEKEKFGRMKANKGVEPKKLLKPILPKLLPTVLSPDSAPELPHGGAFAGNGICYICDRRISQGVRLVNGNLQAPHSGLPTKIGHLMGDSFVVVVTGDDVLCHKCHSLLNHVNRLENELKQFKQHLREQLVNKYHITEPVFSDAQSPPPEQPDLSETHPPKCIRIMPKGELPSLEIPKIPRHKEPIPEVKPRGAHQCTMCDKQFDSNRAIKKHKMSVHLTKWTCHFCNEIFEVENVFTEHMKGHLSETNNALARVSELVPAPEAECGLRNASFQSEPELLEHADSHELVAVHAAPGSAADVYYSCDICNLDFTQEDLYNDHLQTHYALNGLDDLTSLVKPELSLDESVDLMDINMFDNSDDPPLEELTQRFACAHCDTEHETLAEMNEHIQTMHEMKQCSLCPQVVGTQEEVNAHVWQVHGAPEAEPSAGEQTDAPLDTALFNCELCGAQAESEDALNQHLQECQTVQNVMNINHLACSHCGAIAESMEVLSAHVQVCGSELPETEETDGVDSQMTEQEVEELEQEFLEEITDESLVADPPKKKTRSISCAACGEVFPNKRLLLEHERDSPDHLVINCPDCDQRYTRERFLNDHREKQHPTAHCQHCRKAFVNIKQLKAHESRHIRAFRNTFQCDACPKIFQTPTGLRQHKAVHTGDFKYKCEFCGKGFVSRVRSEEHRACHTKEKRYTCEVCGLKFSVQATYWIHKKWHENPKPYSCQECGKLFKHTSLLAVHKRKHSGERPYACNYCNQTFIVSTSLKRHMTLHTGSFPHSCPICNVGFAAKHKMAQHMSKVHDDHKLLMEQISKKSRNYIMAVKDPAKVQEKSSKTWVLTNNRSSGTPGQYLTLETEEGDHILLTDDMLKDSKVSEDGQTFEIVLQGDQPDSEIPYTVQPDENEV